MKKFVNGSKGTTLVEILVVVAIVGAIMGAMSMTVNTLLINYNTNRTETILVRQVENAGYWISRDIQEAVPNTIDLNPGGSGFISLECYNWNPNANGGLGAWEDNQQIDYTVEEGVMRRVVDGISMLIAQYITDIGGATAITVGDNATYTIDITAADRDMYRNGQYEAQVKKVGLEGG